MICFAAAVREKESTQHMVNMTTFPRCLDLRKYIRDDDGVIDGEAV